MRKKFLLIAIILLLVSVFSCACDDIYEVPIKHSYTVSVCEENICSVNIYEHSKKGFRLCTGEEEKMIEAFLSSPYYLGKYTVKYTEDDSEHFGEGNEAYWFDFGNMNIGYVVKNGDYYHSYSHYVYFFSDDYIEEIDVYAMFAFQSFLTSDSYDMSENHIYYDFFSGETYSVAYDWEELKSIFRNYEIDESNFSIKGEVVDDIWEVNGYMTIQYIADVESIYCEVGVKE